MAVPLSEGAHFGALAVSLVSDLRKVERAGQGGCKREVGVRAKADAQAGLLLEAQGE